MPQLLPDELLDPLLAEPVFDETIEFGEAWEFHFGTGCGCDNALYGPHLGVRNDKVNRLVGKPALIQWINMTLATARFAHLIYDSDYGTEFSEIIANSLDADEATTEIEQTILDALLVDDRITNVTSVDVVESEDNASSLIVDVRVVTFEGEFLNILFHDIGREE